MSFYTASILDQAYDWLCQRRKNYSCHADILHLRQHWELERAKLLQQLRNEDYHFEAVRKYQLPDKTIGIWSAKDALVLKMMTIYLRTKLDPILSKQIYHLGAIEQQGKRGYRAAVKKVYEALPDYEFVFRTDVQGYYASIHHKILYKLCAQYIQDPFILKLIKQYLAHHTYEDGIYRSIKKDEQTQFVNRLRVGGL